MNNSPPATTSAGSVPDLVKIKPITTDQTIDVQTSILDPIITNERFVKFQFDNMYRESYVIPPKQKLNLKPSVKTQTMASDMRPPEAREQQDLDSGEK